MALDEHSSLCISTCLEKSQVIWYTVEGNFDLHWFQESQHVYKSYQLRSCGLVVKVADISCDEQATGKGHYLQNFSKLDLRSNAILSMIIHISSGAQILIQKMQKMNCVDDIP